MEWNSGSGLAELGFPVWTEKGRRISYSEKPSSLNRYHLILKMGKRTTFRNTSGYWEEGGINPMKITPKKKKKKKRKRKKRRRKRKKKKRSSDIRNESKIN